MAANVTEALAQLESGSGVHYFKVNVIGGSNRSPWKHQLQQLQTGTDVLTCRNQLECSD